MASPVNLLNKQDEAQVNNAIKELSLEAERSRIFLNGQISELERQIRENSNDIVETNGGDGSLNINFYLRRHLAFNGNSYYLFHNEDTNNYNIVQFINNVRTNLIVGVGSEQTAINTFNDFINNL